MNAFVNAISEQEARTTNGMAARKSSTIALFTSVMSIKIGTIHHCTA